MFAVFFRFVRRTLQAGVYLQDMCVPFTVFSLTGMLDERRGLVYGELLESKCTQLK